MLLDGFGVPAEKAAMGRSTCRLIAVVALACSVATSAQDGKLLNSSDGFNGLWDRLEFARTQREKQKKDPHETAPEYPEQLSGRLLLRLKRDFHANDPRRVRWYIETEETAGQSGAQAQHYRYRGSVNLQRVRVKPEDAVRQCPGDSPAFALLNANYSVSSETFVERKSQTETAENRLQRGECILKAGELCYSEPHAAALVAQGKRDQALGWCMENEAMQKKSQDAVNDCFTRYPRSVAVERAIKVVVFSWDLPPTPERVFCMAGGRESVLWDEKTASTAGGEDDGVVAGIAGGAGSGDLVLKEYEVSDPPKILFRVEPAYPEQALANGQEGKVFLELVVDETGRVVDARVIRADNQLFEQSARAAVMQWRYTPAENNGHPVRTYKNVTIIFGLH